MSENKGKLIIVATPIGNLSDLSPRALEALNSSDLILAEDTRQFGKIKQKFGINTKAISYHEHNEKRRSEEIIKLLTQGQTISLVSDAGTPCISDPGYVLINACHQNQIELDTIPGPSALIAALSISGFDTSSFTFKGFLPVKSGKKEKALKESVESDTTSIFYESPHRILKTLETLTGLSDDKEIFLVRELTKLHQEYFRGRTAEVLAKLQEKQSIKGEFVLII